MRDSAKSHAPLVTSRLQDRLSYISVSNETLMDGVVLGFLVQIAPNLLIVHSLGNW